MQDSSSTRRHFKSPAARPACLLRSCTPYTVTDNDNTPNFAADDDTASETFTITIEQDNKPSLGLETVADQIYIQDERIDTLTLPAATGGDAALTYSLAQTSGTPALPPGLAFDDDANTRQLSGTPTEVQGAVQYTYTVTDNEGTADPVDDDTVTRTFNITVEADTQPVFGNQSVGDKIYTETIAIPTITLPAASGGNAPITYTLTPALPDGLTFDAATRVLSGTPTTPSPDQDNPPIYRVHRNGRQRRYRQQDLHHQGRASRRHRIDRRPGLHGRIEHRAVAASRRRELKEG